MNTSKEVCDKCNTRKDVHYRPMGNDLFSFCPNCDRIRPVEDIRDSCSLIEIFKSIIGWKNE